MITIDIDVDTKAARTFAKYGKRMKDHEANHNPPILEIVEQSVIVDTSSCDEEQDDMLSYQKALLEYGMHILNFWDAISGDGLFVIFTSRRAVNCKVLS